MTDDPYQQIPHSDHNQWNDDQYNDDARPGWLSDFNTTWYAIATSFCVYFCMYAFRKPFAAAKYEGLMFLGTTVGLKTAFTISQVLGYALAKVIGIRVCSEIQSRHRAMGLVVMIGAAELALLLFAVLPPTGKVVAIFLNGLSLGMIWGLVVWYLEGRRTSEVMLAGLSCSFILASGAVKDVGGWLMSDWAVPQFWMPFATGLLFLPPFLISVWLLNRIRPPNRYDVEARVKRQPMTRRERWQFTRQFAAGMCLLMVTYFFLTAYREFRDAFGIEVFDFLGYGAVEGIFTRSEAWVTLGVLAALAALNLIKDNRWGLVGAFAVMTVGTVTLGLGTLAHDRRYITGLTWMILTGVGLYLAYVPFGSVLFDRMIAHTRITGNAVFAIYVADSIGYVGSITMMLIKDMVAGDLSKFEFLRLFTYFMSGLGTVCLIAGCFYFVFSQRPSHATRSAGIGEQS